MAAATPSLLTRRRVVTVLVATLLLLASVPFLWPSSASQVTYFLPRPHTAVTFHRNPALFDLSSNADGNWSALLPPNGGFVVEKNEFGGLEMAGITMFHQLHCLGMIRNAIQELMIDKPMNMENVIGRRHGLHFHQEHWVHCLDYLVQVRYTCFIPHASTGNPPSWQGFCAKLHRAYSVRPIQQSKPRTKAAMAKEGESMGTKSGTSAGIPTRYGRRLWAR